jgi:hypothetical protein
LWVGDIINPKNPPPVIIDAAVIERVIMLSKATTLRVLTMLQTYSYYLKRGIVLDSANYKRRQQYDNLPKNT